MTFTERKKAQYLPPERAQWKCSEKTVLVLNVSAFKPAFISHYLGGFEEEAAMLQVHHLPLQLVLHHIHQSQLISQVLVRKKVNSSSAAIVSTTVCTATQVGHSSFVAPFKSLKCKVGSFFNQFQLFFKLF